MSSEHKYTIEHTHFLRGCQVNVGLYRDMCWAILIEEVPDKDLFTWLNNNLSKFKGKWCTAIYKLLQEHASDRSISKDDCDVSLLYSIFCNIQTTLPPPSRGWRFEPLDTNISITDDVERMRISRNELYAHITTASLNETEFKKLMEEAEAIVERVGQHLDVNGRENRFKQYLLDIRHKDISDQWNKQIKELSEKEIENGERITVLEWKVQSLALAGFAVITAKDDSSKRCIHEAKTLIKDEEIQGYDIKGTIVKNYSLLKQEMNRNDTLILASALLVDHDKITKGQMEDVKERLERKRRDGVEKLLKHVLGGDGKTHSIFVLECGRRENVKEWCDTHLSDKELDAFIGLELMDDGRCRRPPDETKLTFTEKQKCLLITALNDDHKSEVSNDELLSRLCISVAEHTKVWNCEMGNEKRINTLIATMRECNSSVLQTLCDILNSMKMKHIADIFEGRTVSVEQSSDSSHSAILKQESLTCSLCLAQIDCRLNGISTGSITFHLATDSNEWNKLKEHCSLGTIRSLIQQIYQILASNGALEIGEYRIDVTIYTITHLGTKEAEKAFLNLSTDVNPAATGSDDRNDQLDVRFNPMLDHYDILMEELDVTRRLLKRLVDNKCLAYGDIEETLAIHSRSNQAEHLINKLIGHGQKCYNVLQEHLRVTDKDVFNLLQQRDINLKREKFYAGTFVLHATHTSTPEGDETTDKVMVTCPDIINPTCHFQAKEVTGQPLDTDSLDNHAEEERLTAETTMDQDDKWKASLVKAFASLMNEITTKTAVYMTNILLENKSISEDQSHIIKRCGFRSETVGNLLHCVLRGDQTTWAVFKNGLDIIPEDITTAEQQEFLRLENLTFENGKRMHHQEPRLRLNECDVVTLTCNFLSNATAIDKLNDGLLSKFHFSRQEHEAILNCDKDILYRADLFISTMEQCSENIVEDFLCLLEDVGLEDVVVQLKHHVAKERHEKGPVKQEDMDTGSTSSKWKLPALRQYLLRKLGFFYLDHNTGLGRIELVPRYRDAWTNLEKSEEIENLVPLLYDKLPTHPLVQSSEIRVLSLKIYIHDSHCKSRKFVSGQTAIIDLIETTDEDTTTSLHGLLIDERHNPIEMHEELLLEGIDLPSLIGDFKEQGVFGQCSDIEVAGTRSRSKEMRRLLRRWSHTGRKLYNVLLLNVEKNDPAIFHELGARDKLAAESREYFTAEVQATVLMQGDLRRRTLQVNNPIFHFKLQGNDKDRSREWSPKNEKDEEKRILLTDADALTSENIGDSSWLNNRLSEPDYNNWVKDKTLTLSGIYLPGVVFNIDEVKAHQEKNTEAMSSTTTLKEEGNEKFKNGDFDGALSCYTQALEISEIRETEKAVIFKNRAMCRLNVYDFEGAVSDATKALEIVPNDPKALYRRCTAYESLGQVEDAYRDAAMLIKVDPKNPSVKPILKRLNEIIRQKMRSTITMREEGIEKFKNGDFDGALYSYIQALDISELKETEKAAIFKNRAIRRHEVEKAVADATKALEIARNDPTALYRRCTAYESLGKVEDAYRDAALLIKVDPKNPSVKPILNRLTQIIKQKMSSTTTLKEEGNAKFKNGDFYGAMICYTQALEISEIKETEKAVIFKNRAMCRLKVDDFQGAVSDATKALEIAPNDPKALYRRCTAYEIMGKVEEAYRDAALLIKVDPKNPSVKPILNRLTAIIRKKMSSTTILTEEVKEKFKNGDFDGALSCYKQALEISDIKETEKSVILMERAMCRLKLDDSEGAFSDMIEGIDLSIPTIRHKMRSTTTLKEEGNEKFKNGDFDGALSCYTQALEISEIKEAEKVVIFKNRAMCRMKVDDFEGAVSDATKALEIAPNDPKALYRRCTAYESLGKVDHAYRDAALLIKVASKNPLVKPILNRLDQIIKQKMSSTTTLKEEGNKKFKNSDFDGALSCYTQALAISEIKETEKAVIFKNRAMCRLKVDNFEGAVYDATKALEIAPKDPKALYRRSTAYASLGKVEDAYRDAAMLIKVAWNNPSVKQILNRLTPIIRQKEDIFINNVTKATGGREEDGEEWPSQLLFQLCEDLGFSDEEWRLRLRTCDVWSTTPFYFEGYTNLHSGSSSEGLAADVLGSDKDVTWVLSGIKVTESDVISPDEEDDVYKAITSSHPAFYTMNHRHQGNSLSGFSSLSRDYLEKDPRSEMVVLNGTRLIQALACEPPTEWRSQAVQHGPALTSHSTCRISRECDNVIGLHCPSWPTVSEEWKHRLKPYGWPSAELIERVTKHGCEFVSAGHPLSIQKEIEWRLSTSAAERVLIRSFNIVQIQSYFLLKLILVYLIKPYVPESLCSYHMKNIILWQVEKTDPRTWRRDNIAQCFNECLKALYQCLENGDLPQYFIPQQNLFDPKIQGEVRKKLIRVVGGLVQEGWVCLLRCDPFTKKEIGCMHAVHICPCYIRHIRKESTLRKVLQVHKQLISTLHVTGTLFATFTKNCFDTSVSHIKTMQRNTATDDIYRPSQPTIDIFNIFMSSHMGYMMLTVTRGPHVQENSTIYHILQSTVLRLENNCDVDMTSCRLKLATFYYRLGQLHKCIRVVHDVLEKFTTRTVVITDDPVRQNKYIQPAWVFQHLSGLLSMSDDIRALLRHVSFPVRFSPWEIINAPPAVQCIALLRRFESPNERLDYNAVVIDSLVYAYYLMAISYREIGRPVQAERSLNDLRRMLRYPIHYQVYYPYEAQQLLDHCTRPYRN